MNDICRVCFAKDDLSSIFLEQGNTSIPQKIMTLASVSISVNDNLPASICSSCLQRLHYSYKFKLDCEESDAKLRANVKQEDVEYKTERRGGSEENVPKLESNCSYQFESNTIRKKEINELLDIEVGNTDFHIEHKDQSNEISPSKEAPFKDGSLSERSTCDNNEEINLESVKPQKQQCFTCGKVLSSRYRLKMHMRTHTGERPFTCDYCKKTFSLASTLTVHVRVHTGEKPLNCSVCGKSFAHTAGLRAHARLHTGETPYRCTLCPSSFRTPSHLHYHIRQHTGEKEFECETCGKAYITQHALKRHALTHTDHRPHVCHICGLAFLRLYYLKRHMTIHNRSGSHSCKRCSCTFTKEPDLLKHEKDVHEGNSTEIIEDSDNPALSTNGKKYKISIEEKPCPEQLHGDAPDIKND